MIHFNSCFAQKAKTAGNPPSSLSRGVFASSVATSLPLRLASLSEPTDPQAACLAPERRNHSLEMPSAFSVGFYYLEKLPTPPTAPRPGTASPSSGFPLRELAPLPAGKPTGRRQDNGLAQSLDDARPGPPPNLTQVCLFGFQLLLLGFVLLVSVRQLRC